MAKLSSDQKTVTVVRGDTLSEIAQDYAQYITDANGTAGTSLTLEQRIRALVDRNHIADRNFIVIGQVIKLSGTITAEKKNATSTAAIKSFGLQSKSADERAVYANWTWDKAHTKEYKVDWDYKINGQWFHGNDSSVTVKQSVYSGPQNATHVRFRVKPISTTHKVNNKDTNYWTAGWSSWKSYDYSNNPPGVPEAPTIEIDTEFELTASLSNIATDINATLIHFEVWQDNAKKVKSGKATITTNTASHKWTIKSGHEYKVRCRSYRDGMYSEWSNWSSSEITVPSTPDKFTRCEFITSEADDTSIGLAWGKVNTATDYEIEYTTDESYFDKTDQPTKVSTGNVTEWKIVSGLDASYTYYFRLRAKNSKGESKWSEITSTKSGTGPAAPTTWSSTLTVLSGESLNLYWTHTADGGSEQKYACLEVYVDGVKQVNRDFIVGTNNTMDDFVTEVKFGVKTGQEEPVNYIILNTSKYPNGATVDWRIRTAGESMTYGEWSAERRVSIYKDPELTLTVTDNNGVELSADSQDTIESFPINVAATVNAGDNQSPIGYYLKVIAQESYSTIDSVGNDIYVNQGDEIYSKYFDITPDESSDLSVSLTAGDIDLENSVQYVISCTVSLSSGLTSEARSIPLTVSWTDDMYEPNAELVLNEDDYSMSIRPYCDDADGNPITDITLSVYRREFDGRFTEIGKDINGAEGTWVLDPHPALDYARYRIVAKNGSTGAISYYDLPGYPVGCTSIIVQWDEKWSDFDLGEGESAEPTWTGSMIKLPYNIDISESTKKEVALVNYIGRENPVAYYGTHVSTTPSFSVVIPKDDVEAMYTLRRLAIWRGDVYVREPSGMGFWASISVSHSQKHLDVTIPVSFDITRVEGGV